MKVIKLNTIHYLFYKGILLNSDKPFVEATEENVLKLQSYIEAKYVKVVELIDGKELKEESKENKKIIEKVKEDLVEEKEENSLEETTEKETEETQKKTKKTKK